MSESENNYPEPIYSQRLKLDNGLIFFCEVKPGKNGNGNVASLTVVGHNVSKDKWDRNRSWMPTSKDDLSRLATTIGDMEAEI